VSFNGQSIAYDQAGNPTTYRGKTLTWTRGRLLASYGATGSNYITTMQYDASGIRREKLVPSVYGSTTTTFFYNGNNLVREKIVNKVSVQSHTHYKTYLYNSQGVIGFVQGSNTYTYRKNLFGDIVAIYQGSTKVAAYAYDAWGNCTVIDPATGNVSTSDVFIGNQNPFRYRGYYWDSDLQLYYLMSRYYDPQTGRFINVDTIDYLEPDTINGLNLYAYCYNNPITFADPSGHSAILIGLIIGAIVGFATVTYTDYKDDGKIFNGSVKWYEYLAGTVTGAALGAGVGGIIGAGGTYLTKAMVSITNKFISDLFAYTLTGTPFGTWEDYAVAFISGGLINGSNLNKIVKTIYDVAGRPLINQVVKIGTNRTESLNIEKYSYDVVTRGLTTSAPSPWKAICRGWFKSLWDLCR